MKEFVSPEEPLGGLDSGSVSRLITAASDIALIVGSDGVIRDVSISSDDLAGALADEANWSGRPLTACITPEGRPKIEGLLQVAADGPIRAIQLNHPSKSGIDVPILYTAAPAGAAQRIVAFGRDLRSIATLQQRLIESQQSMERDYLRLRQVETQYRLLFETTSEALMVLDAATDKPVEINPVARLLLGETAKRLSNKPFPEFFQSGSAAAVQSFLAVVRATGRSDPLTAMLAASAQEMSISGSLFRQENTSLILVRLLPVEASHNQAPLREEKAKLLAAIEHAPDGFVVTSPDGRIAAVNAAFVDMVQLASEEQLRGTSLEQWLGRLSVDLDVLIANLRQGGAVRLFATRLRGAYGAMIEVEISAVSHVAGRDQFYAFSIRDIGRRISGDARVGRELPRSVEQMTELVGRVPMKDLVREATDLIERLCIEAALELTADNRASAAELLGLSRQSLYVKLRRYGLGELDSDTVPQQS